ncbi:MAG: DUF3040 domain-containing protein [Gordonia sp. (in: high G+C Gram-positive bacteria)]|uniref:DUF3040 domain-containing protein n=1 Tax=Gordonia sp. (in: high G+C Gram-positive bacteria) TaxID=84139 RepID=UPI0039E253E8
MPLSEHEQRMLDEIESALYAEDPKFASTVSKKQRTARPGGRRRWQAALLMVVGLALLIGGLMVDIQVGDFKILSLIGFLVMFAGGLLLLIGPRTGSAPAEKSERARAHARGSSRGSFSARMEDRFNRRFDQDGR